MFRRFFSGGGEAWPISKVVSALEAHYGIVNKLGEDGPLSVYGVEDNGVNFVVALMQTAAGSGNVAELGFLARFVGFEVETHRIESLNRNLHISVASIEPNGELFLMAGLEVTGDYDQSRFMLMLDAWRRDLMMTLHGISGGPSLAAAFPAAGMEAARDFAMNVAPAPAGDQPIDMLSSFLNEKQPRTVCADCGGRGKRGLIARNCDACAGAGFVRGQ